MLDEFIPKIVDKDQFVKHYEGARLEIVIEDMGWVTEANRILNSLEMIPDSKNLQERIYGMIAGMQHDLPMGNSADLQLQSLKFTLQQTKNYKYMQKYHDVLDDLMQGYRKLLKERYIEL